MGPNVKILVAMKIAQDAVPACGGFKDDEEFFFNREMVIESARKAQKWVDEAIQLVLECPDNKFGNSKEAVAGEVLRQLREQS